MRSQPILDFVEPFQGPQIRCGQAVDVGDVLNSGGYRVMCGRAGTKGEVWETRDIDEVWESDGSWVRYTRAGTLDEVWARGDPS